MTAGTPQQRGPLGGAVEPQLASHRLDGSWLRPIQARNHLHVQAAA